ncbi:MAG: addiction module protein [Verrucomicrobiota bacterium JB022]|nr:addiction module protein [Verrucomicrobiota bacterium JB022]
MDTRTETLCREALALPKEDRTYLVKQLLESFEQGDDLSPAWEAEIVRRLHDLESGKVQPIPAEEVHARLREKLFW